MNKLDFTDWRDHPVTKEAFEAVAEAAGQLVAELVNNSEIEPQREQYLRGYIRGIQAMLEWDPELDD